MSPSRIEDQATCLTLRQYSTGTVFKSLLAHSLYTPSFLGALAKFRKATITFVTSVCLHMLPDLTLNFTCNFFCNDLIFYLTVRVIARCVRQYDKTNTDKTHPSPGSQALLVSPHKSARSDAWLLCILLKRRDSPVRIVTRLRAGQPRNRGSIPDRCKKECSLLQHVQTGYGPPSLLLSGYLELSPRAKTTGALSRLLTSMEPCIQE